MKKKHTTTMKTQQSKINENSLKTKQQLAVECVRLANKTKKKHVKSKTKTEIQAKTKTTLRHNSTATTAT